ncbi:MAG: hypothetical protein HOG25_15090 [Gammaproteobacteria bacterium]|nr:hypothetical protein [Gammaproteobacteria bacterium]
MVELVSIKEFPSPEGKTLTKFCNTCGVEKPLEAYYKATRNKDGRMNICMPCDVERRRVHNSKNPEKRKNAQLKWRYGIDNKDWARMFDEQGGHCAACGDHQSEIDAVFCVDHNHETGAVRSLLCNPCNSTIGYAKESSERLDACSDYLRKHNEEHRH